MSKHFTSLIVDTDIEKAFDSALHCLSQQNYRILKNDRPNQLQMERGNPWYATIFLTPGFTTSWKQHYCHLTASFDKDTNGKVMILCDFNWKYSIMRQEIMNNVDDELAGISDYLCNGNLSSLLTDNQ
jgi:hypothetical protein